VAFNIQNKLMNMFNNEQKKVHLCPGYCHGMVNGIGFENGSIYEHVDPIYIPNTVTIHCNIISQKSEGGGITYIDEIKYETDETDVLIYPVSKIKHSVDKIVGDVPRILWVFGFCMEL
jgi:4-hydroxy-3-methylbut-2-enyl diphosphate reductase IspH